MSSHMINLFLCILSSLYLCFGLLYFCYRILPRKCKISLPLFLCLSVFMALLFWIKRESQHNGITIVFQLTIFLVILFLFQTSFMKKLAVYFIFQLLIICPEILCTSVFIALHNLFIPTDTYTPHNLISSCSPAEYFVIELSNILLGLFLLWKISEILRQCIDYLKILTFLQLLLPLIAPVFLNVIISLQKKPEAVLALSIIYWIICIGSYLLFLHAVRSLAQQHREYLQKKMEIELMKKQMNDSVQLSNEYASLRKWNHDIENHIMSVMYLMDMKKYEEAETYTASVLLFLRAVHSLAQQHREYLQKKMEIELMKKQINDSVQLSNEYASLRKWNHDIENHIMSVMYLMDMKKYEEAETYTASVLSRINCRPQEKQLEEDCSHEKEH